MLKNVAVGGLRCSVLNRKSVGVPEDAVADRSLRFPAFCNALGVRLELGREHCILLVMIRIMAARTVTLLVIMYYLCIGCYVCLFKILAPTQGNVSSPI